MKKELKIGEEENKDFRRCTQTNCAFYQKGGCKSCETCGAKSFELDKTCKRCFACENEPNALRWGDKDLEAEMEKNKQEQQVLTKDISIMVGAVLNMPEEGKIIMERENDGR